MVEGTVYFVHCIGTEHTHTPTQPLDGNRLQLFQQHCRMIGEAGICG